MRLDSGYVAAALIVLSLFALTASVQAQDDAPEFPVPALSDYVPQLAEAIQLIGENRVEESFNSLDTDLNPAFQNQASLEKFRQSWMKLFTPVGRLRLEFESFDVVAYYQVSTQAYFLYGTANGAKGPVMLDFRVFQYRGRWHVHGFSFRASGWKREPKIHDDATHLPEPISYPLGDRPVADADRLEEKNAGPDEQLVADRAAP